MKAILRFAICTALTMTVCQAAPAANSKDADVFAAALTYFAATNFDVMILDDAGHWLTNGTQFVIADHNQTNMEYSGVSDGECDDAAHRHNASLSNAIKRDFRVRNSQRIDLSPLLRALPVVRLAAARPHFIPTFARDSNARAFLNIWLPGYAEDGRSALLAFEFGPTCHGAVAILALVKNGGKWRVKWCDLVYFL